MAYTSENKNVNPSHYKLGGLEAIDIIDIMTKGLSPAEAFSIGNAIKYISRYKRKNGVEDLEKAMWYLQHTIDILKTHDEIKK